MNFLNKIVDGIDDSRIVKQAYRAFYYLLGGLLGIGTILCSVYIYNTITDSSLFEFKTWSKIVFLLLFTVYTAILIASGVVIFLYWKKHGDAIGATKSKYPNNLFVADFIQTLNNSYVFSCLVAIVSAAVLLYLGLILTGELQIYHEKNFLYATGILIGVILAYVIIFMIITMINNFIVERIKQRIQISDDLSDVADVMRSAQIVKDEIVVAEPELHTQPDLPACPDCGTQLPPNTATCPNCGCPVNN
jgi:hypothetical protein